MIAGTEAIHLVFCGATRLGTSVPTQRVHDTLTLLTECLLRLTYFIPLALKKPFACISCTALPPAAALCNIPSRLLTFSHRFVIHYHGAAMVVNKSLMLNKAGYLHPVLFNHLRPKTPVRHHFYNVCFGFTGRLHT